MSGRTTPRGQQPASTGTASVRVPLIKPDLPAFEDVEDQFREIMTSGRITNFGRYVTELEARAGDYLGTSVATVSSGTMALIMALQSLGVERGDKVVLPSFTFVATAQAVLYIGAIPVFVEVESDLTISPRDVAALLHEHEVAAVLPVHTYGLPCRVDDLAEVVAEANRGRAKPIRILYDAAHAFGSSLGSRRVGEFGDAETFSLSVTKALVTVEGGMISTRDARVIRRIQKMRNYGIEANYDAHWPGLNGKMSEFHAIVGVENLKRLPERLALRAKSAQYYAERISHRARSQAMMAPEGVTHTYKDYTVVVPPDLKRHRDRIMAIMAANGVETRAYFSPPVHQQQFFRQYADRPLPVTEDMAQRVITLPFYTTISTAEMDYVAESLVEAEASVAGR